MRDLWRKDYGAIVANRAAISCVLNSAFVLFMLTKAIFSLFQLRLKPMKTTLDLPLFPPLAAFDKTAPPSTLSSRAPANFQRKFGKPRDLLCAPPPRKRQQAQVAAQPHRKALAFLLALLLAVQMYL
jgi:hypothetical protein